MPFKLIEEGRRALRTFPQTARSLTQCRSPSFLPLLCL